VLFSRAKLMDWNALVSHPFVQVFLVVAAIVALIDVLIRTTIWVRNRLGSLYERYLPIWSTRRFFKRFDRLLDRLRSTVIWQDRPMVFVASIVERVSDVVLFQLIYILLFFAVAVFDVWAGNTPNVILQFVSYIPFMGFIAFIAAYRLFHDIEVMARDLRNPTRTIEAIRKLVERGVRSDYLNESDRERVRKSLEEHGLDYESFLRP